MTYAFELIPRPYSPAALPPVIWPHSTATLHFAMAAGARWERRINMCLYECSAKPLVAVNAP